MSRDEIRVAAAQFATTTDLAVNLRTAVRMLDQAAAADADLIVFPEFANHLSVYEDADHCRATAVELDGPWMGALATRVAEHGVHLVVTVTVPRPHDRVTVTNVLIGPDGSIVATADKQTLMGNERAHLSGGEAPNPIAHTDFGPIGMYSCMDGVTFETPRGFAVRGARLLTNSLNSFALDEAALHIPVRAAENGVFVVASNKVGPLLPPDQVATFSAALGVPEDALSGAGESQIVAPDGEVLAKAPRTGEAVVVADIDLGIVDHGAGDLTRRRPETYGALANDVTSRPREAIEPSVAVRCVPSADATLAASAAAGGGEARLIVLPEGTPAPDEIAPGVLVVTTRLEGASHVGQAWASDGLAHQQRQLHRSDRYPDVTDLADRVELFATPWADLAIVVGDDYRYPETFRLAAIAGAHAAIVCYRPQHRWEVELAMLERAAENRICLVACAPATGIAGTMVLNPPADSLWSPDRSRPYEGTINTPEAHIADPDAAVFDAVMHTRRALDREVSRDTDLVGGRSWQASSVLVT